MNFSWAFCLLVFYCCACNPVSKKSKPNVFHYNQPNYITSLDPAFAKTQNNMWAIEHIFNQLIDLDSSLQLQAEIAKSWTVDSSGLHYEFIIDNSFLFHEDTCFGIKKTRNVTAYDVEFSLKRLLDPLVNSPGSWLFANKIQEQNGFLAINDSVFTIHLQTPFTPILNILTMQYCSIVPKEATLFYQETFRKHPVGSGPFKLKTWLDRQGIFLLKNNEYPKAHTITLDGVRISFMEDRSTAYLEFLKKKIDFFSGIQSSFALQVVERDGQIRKDYQDQFQLLRSDYLNTEFIGINFSTLPKQHPLQNKKVRQALNYAINKEKLVSSLRFGMATPANKGFIPKGLLAYQDELIRGYSFDVAKAKSLLEESGVDWTKEEPLVIYTNKDYVDLITIVAKEWEEIGIPVKIELLETGTLREQMRVGSLHLFRASWIADYPDEENFLTVFYSKNPAPPNYTRFSNTEFDRLYERSLSETHTLLRQNHYREMNRIITDEAPFILLFYDQTAWFVQKNIENLIANPINLLKLSNVSKNSN